MAGKFNNTSRSSRTGGRGESWKTMDIPTTQSGKRWLEILASVQKFDDLLLDLGGNDEQLKKLKKAFSLISLSDMQPYDFILKLGDRLLARGSLLVFVDNCCKSINESSFLRSVSNQIARLSLNDRQISALVWIVNRLMISDATWREVNTSNHILQLGKYLKHSNPDLEGILSSSENIFVEDILSQHQNDFPYDYRKISIIPTIDELTYVGPPRLQSSNFACKSPSVVSLLDKQFRCMREDMMNGLKEELGVILGSTSSNTSEGNNLQNSTAVNSPRLHGAVRFINYETTNNKDCYFALSVAMNEQLIGKLRKEGIFPASTENSTDMSKPIKRLKDFFTSRYGSKVAAKNSLVVLLRDGAPVAVGIIKSMVVEEEFAKYALQGHLRIGLYIPDNEMKLLLLNSDFPVLATSAYIASSPFFSYEPILHRLQQMTSIPFQREIVGAPTDSTRIENIYFELSVENENALSSDTSQLEAARAACRSPVTVIQGPPGTGKTFIGVQLATAILENYPHAKILCLCYTNHALDSFLESIIENGVSKDCIKRLGYSPKISENIKQLCLSQGRKLENWEYRRYCEWRESLKKDIDDHSEIWSKIKLWGNHSFCDVEEYLFSQGMDEDLIQISNTSNEDGSEVVGKKGKVQQADYSFRQWIEGKKMPISKECILVNPLWSLSLTERKARLHEWNTHSNSVFAEEYVQHIKHCRKMSQQIIAIDEERKEAEICAAKIIACTTSGAASSHHLLQTYAATHIIIEEAAEILEAHVLSSLTENVQQLIMIGDHKQLRPKVEKYDLKKVSGSGIDYDVSLFERIVLNNNQKNIPVHMLNIQHRMRPEFSEIIRRSTYPSLIDHMSTTGRSDIRGLQKNMIFVTHTEPDSSSDHDSNLDKVSHTNVYEAGMVVNTASYLLKQGYQDSDIVILTPYLGQLLLIKAQLAKFNLRTQLSSRDADELLKYDNEFSDIQEQEVSIHEKISDIKCIRVSTIDNFQGEESKIVIGSLVRSNYKGAIGFLYEPERVNVFFSRARDGMIVFGNSECLTATSRGKGVWNPIVDYLKAQRMYFTGLPIVCQYHLTQNLVQRPEEFSTKCPEGGCTVICGAKNTSCPEGHLCEMFCHMCDGNSHANVKCVTMVEVLCNRKSHMVRKKCSDSNSSVRCMERINTKCKRGVHDTTQLCHLQVKAKCHQKYIGACSKGHSYEVSCCETQDVIDKNCQVCRKIESSQMTINENHSKITEEALKELMDVETSLEETKIEVSNQKELSEIQHRIVKATKEKKTLNKIKTGLKNGQFDEQGSNSKIEHQDSTIMKANIAKTHSEVDFFPLELKSSRNVDISKINNQTEVIMDKERSNCKADRNGVIKLKADKDLCAKSIPSAPYVLSNSKVSSSTSSHTPSEACSSLLYNDSIICSNEGREVSDQISSPPYGDTFAEVQQIVNQMAASNPAWMDVYDACEGLSNKINQPKNDLLLQQIVLVLEGIMAYAEYKTDFSTLAQLQLTISGLVKRFHNIGSKITAICSLLLYLDFLVTKLCPSVGELLSVKAFDFYDSLTDGSEIDFPEVWSNEAKRCIRETSTSFRSTSKKNETQIFESSNNAYDVWQMTKSNYLKSREQSQDNIVSSNRAANISNRDISRNAGVKKNSYNSKKSNQKNSNEEEAAKIKESPSEAIDKLLEMTGLEKVKRDFISIYDSIEVAKKRGDSGASSYNIRCDGNPGTGKTTVARLYGKLLQELEIVPKSAEFIETSGSKLIGEGLSSLKKTLDDAKDNEGCILFIDEAYQLNPAVDSGGRLILDFILTVAESLHGAYGAVVFIIAGYSANMDKLFEHNPGLPSRFPRRLLFEDYTNEELEKIFRSYLKNGVQQGTMASKSKTVTKSNDASGNNNALMRGRGLMYNDSFAQDQQRDTDEWGNTWTFEASTTRWLDEYGNLSGFGPNYNRDVYGYNRNAYGYSQNPYELGSPSNPVVSVKTGNQWIYDRNSKEWYDAGDPEKRLKHYPGKIDVPAQRSVALKVNDDKWIRIAVRRIGTGRGRVGFGNARAIRGLYDRCKERQASRISDCERRGLAFDIFELQRDDILGPKATTDSLRNCKAYHDLQAMEGLSEVKDLVSSVMQLVIQNAEKEEQEKPLVQVALNRVFLGNPGTGKTTVAIHYAEILKHLGLLSKGDVIKKNPSDFVGSVLGSSESQTRGILAQAEGCVLVIDEAYLLNPSSGGGGTSGSNDPYKSAVIDTIVEQVQGVPGDDKVVIMLGYRKEMENMFRAANPGLARRFQIENAFEFKDYDDQALLRILKKAATAAEFELDMRVARFAIKQLVEAKSLPNFGNAGAVNNLLSRAKMNATNDRRTKFTEADFCVGGVVPKSGNEEEIFADLVGCDEIVKKLRTLRATIMFAKSLKQDHKEMTDFNYIFAGSPGTGKTTVARRIGKLYHSLGLLPFDDVVEISASDLMTGYVGQTGKKTKEVVAKARGRVLFIDEAYQLIPSRGGSFAQEAIDELVKEMTSLDNMYNLVIILAGYDREMRELLQVNPGLSSRFTGRLEFKDFDSPTIHKLLMKLLQQKGLCLNDSPHLQPLIEQFRSKPNFSNGRDIHNLVKIIYQNCARSGSKEVTNGILEESFSKIIHQGSPHLDSGDGFKHSVQTIQPPLNRPKYATMYMNMAPPSIDIEKEVRKQVVRDDRVEELDIKEEATELENKSNLPAAFTSELQNVLDQLGLNSKEGVNRLRNMNPNSAGFQDIARQIQRKTNLALNEVIELMKVWQSESRNIDDILSNAEQEIEKAKKLKKKTRVPIWRCGVCGRADQPYIACYVQPYIVRYQEMDFS